MASRPNLVILTAAQATAIQWAPATAGSTTRAASGVSFIIRGLPAVSLTAHASKEVILSAGAIQTPQLLELSGVGDPQVLQAHSISTVVALPGVGANLQDHPAVVNIYKLKPGVESLDTLQGEALTTALAEYAQGQGSKSFGWLACKNILVIPSPWQSLPRSSPRWPTSPMDPS